MARMKAGPQHMQDVHDRTSHGWSFGSINYPSSQSRKISIGVMVSSLPKAKRNVEASKDDDTIQIDPERVKINVRSPSGSGGKSKVEELTASTKLKQTEADTGSFSRITTKPIYQNGTTSRAILFPERNSKSPDSGNAKLDGVSAYSGHHTPVLQLDDDKVDKFSGVTYARKKKKDRITEATREFTFATEQDVPIPDKETGKKNENIAESGRTVNLRLRLQEILGTVSSPKDHDSKFSSEELGDQILNPEQNHNKLNDTAVKTRQSSDRKEHTSDHLGDALSNSKKICNEKQKSDLLGDALSNSKESCKGKQKSEQMGDFVFKPRQNSDTIETDSDCPDQRREKPVTRSSTRRKAPTKTRKSFTKSRCDKVKHQDKTFLSDEDGFPIGVQARVGGRSSTPVEKKSEKNFRVKRLNLFYEKDKAGDVADKVPEASHGSGKTRDSHGHMSNTERQDPGLKENNAQNSPLTSNRGYGGRDIDKPAVEPEDNFGSPSVRNFLNQPNALQSPTFRVDTPASTPKVSGFTSLQSNKFKSKTHFSASLDDRPKLKDSPVGKASSSKKEKKASLSEASSDNSELESSEEDTPSSDEFDRCGESGAFFREISTDRKQKFMPRPTKRLRSHEINVQPNQTKTSSPSSKGNEDCNWIPRSSENKADGLARALELLASGLEKIKCKIKTVTSKKSSEILMSVAEDVHMQLQNVESHIQTDMGKLKSVTKLKRKRVETRMEEQQERLQSIYVKFKEQINQYLRDCESTFEGLEAEQIEVKAVMEKQKKAHGKLVWQVEEAIEMLLSDAQRRITATHECARGKMVQLKQLVALCLKEDILS